jgi:multidrug efflux system outer membrane protein
MGGRWQLAMWLAVGLAGCTVGPDYRRPALDVPPAWRLNVEEAAQISTIAWWDRFGDPVLSRLVRTALENNNFDMILNAILIHVKK